MDDVQTASTAGEVFPKTETLGTVLLIGSYIVFM